MNNTTTTKTDFTPPESVARVWLHDILAGMMSGHCGIHVGLVWRGIFRLSLATEVFPSLFVNFGPAWRSAGSRKLLHNKDI